MITVINTDRIIAWAEAAEFMVCEIGGDLSDKCFSTANAVTIKIDTATLKSKYLISLNLDSDGVVHLLNNVHRADMPTYDEYMSNLSNGASDINDVASMYVAMFKEIDGTVYSVVVFTNSKPVDGGIEFGSDEELFGMSEEELEAMWNSVDVDRQT